MSKDESPFQFAARPVDPTGRVKAAAPPATPARRSRRQQEPIELEDLLRQSIRAVVEREISRARSAEDLTELLRLSLAQVAQQKGRKRSAVAGVPE